MKCHVTLVLLLVSLGSNADYLRSRRDTSIKKQPYSNSEKIFEIEEGDHLILLDDGRQNRGYYHVQYPDSDVKGYIYRTLVEKIKGEFPRFWTNGSEVEITVIDVDAGMSAFIRLPNGKNVVYDAGLYNRAYDYIKSRLRLKSEIEFLILSHTDADHWGSAKEIIENYTVKNIIRTDYRANKRSETLKDGVKAINKIDHSFNDLNLSVKQISPGSIIYDKDGIQLYFLAGFGELPEEWKGLTVSKKNNGVSIVVKLVYGDHSIIFTGDAVGRKDGKNGCIATEEFMLKELAELDSATDEIVDPGLLDADVLIAAHHGADNGSCSNFIEAVSPQYVVFPSGHNNHHPNLSTAKRFYEDYKLPKNNIYRTDTYDREPGGQKDYQKEWNYPYTSNDQDIPGDDHVRIVFPKKGNIKIGYERLN